MGVWDAVQEAHTRGGRAQGKSLGLRGWEAVPKAHTKVVLKSLEDEDGGISSDEARQLFAPAPLFELLVELLQ